MDPEAPKPRDRGDSAESGGDEARKRVDSLTEKKPDSKETAGSGKGDGKPVLTERQRIEARKARQARRRRPVQGNPLSRGMRATGLEIRRTAAFIGGAIIALLAALGPVFSSAGMGIVWLGEQGAKGITGLARLIGRVVAAAGRAVVSLDRVVTPHRALLLVAGLAAILLGVSQYKGLGQIEIGQTGYSGIEDLARAPAIDHSTPAGAHTQILVPAAALALVSVAVILLGGLGSFAGRLGRFRRSASLVLVAVGLATLALALLIDLPDATDTSQASLAYSGVRAVLLSGFWLELSAGATLAIAGLALLLEPSPGKARERRTDESRSRRDRTPETVASSSRLSDGTSTMRGSQA